MIFVQVRCQLGTALHMLQCRRNVLRLLRKGSLSDAGPFGGLSSLDQGITSRIGSCQLVSAQQLRYTSRRVFYQVA
jgi:hypothetical protein